MHGAGRFIAGERGAFDRDEAPQQSPPVEHAPTCLLWSVARIDAASVEYLAALCGCSVLEFTARYEQ